MSRDPIRPGKILRVIIRDDSPLIHCDDHPSYRSVGVELTDDQLDAIKLRWAGSSRGNDHYESISKCFIEEQK